MSDPRLARLRWRCRRGMRELDQLFVGWLDAQGHTATPAMLDTFEALLACEDSDLWAWAVGRARPGPVEWQVLIDQIRRADPA
jgi:antitoxin CptB